MATGDGKVLAELERMLNDASRARTAVERNCWLGTAFYLGEHHIEWSNKDRLLQRRSVPSTVPETVANKLYHFAVKLHTNARLHDPRPETYAVSGGPSQQAAASMTQAYLDWLMEPDQMDWDSVLSEADMYAVVNGEAYIKWFWDTRANRPGCCAVSPLELYVDPSATRFASARYVIHSRYVSVEEVYDLYGVDVQPQTKSASERNGLTVHDSMGYATESRGTTLRELWEPPSRRHPDGRFAAWVPGRVLQAPTAFPYSHKQIPFSQIGISPIPGTPHYMSPVLVAIPTQTELNAYHGQRLAGRKAAANSKWVIDSEQAAAMEEMPNDAPDQILVVDTRQGTLVPQQISGTLPPDNGDGEMLIAEMRDVMGLHAVSQGDAPGRVDSARALELLRGEDDSHLSEMRRLISRAVTYGFGQVLQLARQYGTSQVSVPSRDGVTSVRFRPAGLPEDMGVRVAVGTRVPKTRAALAEGMLQLWNAGLLGQDPLVVLRVLAPVMDLPVDMVLDALQPGRRAADAENLELLAGNPVTPRKGDSHEVHLGSINEFLSKPEYRNLSPDTMQKFDYHADMHRKFLSEQQVEQQLQAQESAMMEQEPAQAGQDPGPRGTGPLPVGEPPEPALDDGSTP